MNRLSRAYKRITCVMLALAMTVSNMPAGRLAVEVNYAAEDTQDIGDSAQFEYVSEEGTAGSETSEGTESVSEGSTDNGSGDGAAVSDVSDTGSEASVGGEAQTGDAGEQASGTESGQTAEEGTQAEDAGEVSGGAGSAEGAEAGADAEAVTDTESGGMADASDAGTAGADAGQSGASGGGAAAEGTAGTAGEAADAAAQAAAQAQAAAVSHTQSIIAEEGSKEFDASQTVDGVKVSVYAPEGVFPRGSVLSVKKVEKEERIQAIDDSVRQAKGITEEEAFDEQNRTTDRYIFDIKVLYKGEEIQPDTSAGEVSVTFTLDRHYKTEVIDVYHVTGETEEDGETRPEGYVTAGEDVIPSAFGPGPSDAEEEEIYNDVYMAELMSDVYVDTVSATERAAIGKAETVPGTAQAETATGTATSDDTAASVAASGDTATQDGNTETQTAGGAASSADTAASAETSGTVATETDGTAAGTDTQPAASAADADTSAAGTAAASTETTAPAVIDATMPSGEGRKEYTTVTVTTGSFSYFVVEVLLEKVLTASDGSTYKVSAIYDRTAELPADATLEVTPLEEDAASNYLQEAAEALGNKAGDPVWYSRFFDISIKSGEENCEPLEPIYVTIELLDVNTPEEVTAADPYWLEDMMQLVHFTNDGGHEVIENRDCYANEDASYELGFETGGFSVYGVVVNRLERVVTATDGSRYEISVTYDAASGIREKADLAVREITEDEWEYIDYTTLAEDKLGIHPESTLYTRLFDISIVDAENGLSLQPNDNVKVSIRLLDQKLDENTSEDDEAELRVIHFDSEPELIESAVNGEDLEFETGGFSVYAVTQVVLEKILKASDDSTYKITVSYGSETGIPVGLELSVNEIKSDNGMYHAFVKQTADALSTSVDDLNFARAFDIKLVDPETGEKYQLDHTVNVSIQLLNQELGKENERISVVHFADDPDGLDSFRVHEVESKLNGDAVEFTTDGFSVYILVGTQQQIEYASLLEAIAQTPEGETIKLTEDETGFTLSNKTITIDLDGHTLTTSSIQSTSGTLTLMNCTIISSSDDLTINAVGGPIILGAGLTVDAPLNQIASDDNLAVTIDGATVTGPVTVKTTSNLTVSGGVIDNDVNVVGGSTLTVTGGTFTGTISADEGSTVRVSGGSFDQTLPQEWIEDGANISGVTYEAVITANSASRAYDGTALTDSEYTVTGLLEGYTLEGISTTGSQTTVGTSENAFTGTPVIKNSRGEDVTEKYTTITMVPGTLEVTKRSVNVNVTGQQASVVYDGTEHTVNGYDVVTGDSVLKAENITCSNAATAAQTNAGTAYMGLTAADFAIDEEIAGNFEATFNVTDGFQTVTPAPVTLTANRKVCNYDGTTTFTVSGYTCSVEGLEFENVTASASGIEKGTYPVVIHGVTLNETKDTTGNYVVTQTVDEELIIADLVKKRLVKFEGNSAYYEIKVNNDHVTLNKGNSITLKDTFTNNQSIYYDSVSVSDDSVIYDYSQQTGTFTIPDGTTVTITYTTRALASAGDRPEVSNTSTLGAMEKDEFVPWGSATVTEECAVEPSESDIAGESGVYTIKIFTYADGHMEKGLGGAVFQLSDYNQKPITYKKGARSGQKVTFTTGDDGFVTVKLTEDEDGVYIHKNTVYYLEMIKAPVEVSGGHFTYYQKDNTLLNFLIKDSPEYSTDDSGIYSFFNDDVLKVRCYEESSGINVTTRFSGNYTPTDSEKNNIEFVLEKENTLTGRWDEVERHNFSEFEWGSLQFNKGKDGWDASDYGATYRVREENAEIEGVDLNMTCVVSSQYNGETRSEEIDEFLVDPDHQAYSFSLTFTNEYSNHKLTFYAIDEDMGTLLKNVEITSYKVGETDPVSVYLTGTDGTTDITYSSAYEKDTLYYAVQTNTTADYIMPDDPVKAYFYFSDRNKLVPSGLPEGETAIDLSESFTTVAISNSRVKTHYPVIVLWETESIGYWPDTIDRVLVKLFQSVDGGSSTETDKSVELNKNKLFDNSVFDDLPLRDAEGHRITYSLVQTIYDSGDQDITDQYAVSDMISSSGWHVLRNQTAASVTVNKEWYALNGTKLDHAPEGVSSVSFDLYRTTTKLDETSFTREALRAALASAVLVRTGHNITADNNWTKTVNSLQKTDSSGNPYYYYALEDEDSMPENHIDSYVVTAVGEGLPDELTIRNTQTPVTVTIQAPKDASKIYGDADPKYAKTGAEAPDFPIVISIGMQGAEATCTAVNAEAGQYSVEVTEPGGATNTLYFSLTREVVESVGSYTLTPSGDASQSGYRVVYKTGSLTINRAEVRIDAGKDDGGNNLTKIYGDADPALASITGLKLGDPSSIINYECYREPGEDVGSYQIWVNGDEVQGNYRVILTNGSLEIRRAEVTVEPVSSQGKVYGENEPEIRVVVSGLTAGDSPSVISYGITRAPGEAVGSYAINVSGDTIQGNYTVAFRDSEFTIRPATLTITVDDAEKAFGDEDPEWNITLDGLQRGDQIVGSPTTEHTAAGTKYTYALSDEGKTIVFTMTGGSGVNVGEYDIVITGDADQGNYKLAFDPGKLYIRPAHLTVTASDIVKDVNETTDPPLTAVVDGWKNSDGDSILTTTESGGIYTCVYKLNDQVLLSFTLSRDPGDTEGDYGITPSGEFNQGNYEVEYVSGTFSILSVFDIDVRQITTDRVNPAANPAYQYQALVDLAGTGLTTLTGFEHVSGSLWKKDFELPNSNTDPGLEVLKIPVGAKLTVTQQTNSQYDVDYESGITLDGDPYTPTGDSFSCSIDQVNEYYAIGFSHTRICLPVTAMAGVGQTETDAVPVSPGGFMGIPNGVQTIDKTYVVALEGAIGYSMPTDKYYDFHHPALYHEEDGTRIDDVISVQYTADTAGGTKLWRYTVNEGGGLVTKTVPDDAVLRLYYYPKYICKVGEEKFYTLNQALEGRTQATIEMLLGEFRMPVSDVLTIPAGSEITLTTAATEYEGESGTTAVISRSAALSGNMFKNNGTLILDRIIIDGNKDQVTGADAMVLNTGTLTVNGNAILQNANGANGGAVYMTGGTATVNGSIRSNSAVYGGAIYVAGGEVALAGTIGGDSGNANSATYGGAVFMTGGTVEVSGGAVSYNTASTNGGAFYLEGGTVRVSGGTVGYNRAENDGGMLYATGGNITVSGGTVSNNVATQGNGGAISYNGPGSVVISGGTIQANKAISGNGGVVYQSSGTVTISGTINGQNQAKNGSAIYVASGIANFNGCNINNNKTTITDGGAVGVDAAARLYFSGNAIINNNKNINGNVHNLYLDEDSDEIINVPAAGLGGSADIRVYVADSVLNTRGEVCCSFGSYVGSSNLTKFQYERISNTYSVYSTGNKLYWGKAIKFTVRYKATGLPAGTGDGSKQLWAATDYYPKSTSNPIYDLVTTLSNDYYHDKITSGYIYSYSQVKNTSAFEEYITAIDWDSTNRLWVFKLHDGTSVSNQSEFTIYYQDAAFLSITNNDSHDLVVDPLTVLGKNVVTAGYGYVIAVNNVTQTTMNPITESTLTIPAGGSVRLLFPGATSAAWSNDGVFSEAGSGTEIIYSLNGGNSQTLPISDTGSFALNDNLSSNAGVIYNILFGQASPICKVEDSEGDHPFTSLKRALEFITNASKDTHAEGEQWYKPGDGGDVKLASIKMLVDYQQPSDDILVIPEGYKITLTTADPKPAAPEAGKYYYEGEGMQQTPARATISRSSGDIGSAVKALIKDGTAVLTTDAECTTSLTISNLVFDGKALGQGGQGGAVNTSNVKVSINNCDFKGYTANRGGAIYTKWGQLSVTYSNFENCRVNASEDKTGGGGIWTTTKALTVDHCRFTNCEGTGQAQGSAVFHNIRYDGAVVHPKDGQKFPTGFSNGSQTTISNCDFVKCTSNGSGGTIESDAWTVCISDCTFNGSKTLKSGGNGGAINIYTNDNKSIPATGRVEIRRCHFTDCSAPNGKTNGGAVRTLSPILVVEDSTFTNVSSNYIGGAISMTNKGSSITITGSVFDGCSAGSIEESHSGAVYANALSTTISGSLFKDCKCRTYGGVNHSVSDNNSITSITDSSFVNCSSSNSAAGAVYSAAISLSFSGNFAELEYTYHDKNGSDTTKTYAAQDYTFNNCTASGNGGAVCHNGSTKNELTNCIFYACSSQISGGGAYLEGAKLEMTGTTFQNCKAVKNGGGLYISTNNTNTITNCIFDGNWVTDSDGMGGALFINQNTATITGGEIKNSKAAKGGGIYQKGTLNLNGTEISNCYAVVGGGGLYHEGTVTAYGKIENCFAKQGGGIYSASALNFTNADNAMTVSNCYATTVTLNTEDGTATPASGTQAVFTADNQGGGVYNSGGTFAMSSAKASISGCKAYDGGAVYQAGGTFNLSGGTIGGDAGTGADDSIPGNSAANNGGGIYHAGGSFTMSGGVIGGTENLANQAGTKGGGVFVADGQTMTMSGGSITYNTATAGGGIAVGGALSRLIFQGIVTVQNNKMGSDEICNVYLDQDTNEIIRTSPSAALNAGAYIGVYVTDVLMDDHGVPSKPFGTFDNESNLSRFFHDRPEYRYYYGTKGSVNSQIVWAIFVCKITDAEDNILYKDAACTIPAVYSKLENSATADSAFASLTGTFYRNGTPYSGEYKLQMLVQEYSAAAKSELSGGKTVTLTTASTTADECGFKYTGDPKHPYAEIKRSASYGSMIQVKGGSNLTLANIILDGGYDPNNDSGSPKGTEGNGGILFITESNTSVTIGENATLRNSKTNGNGGAIRLESSGGILTLANGGRIENCIAGGDYGGGGVSVKYGTFNMTGGTITGCSAVNGGGIRMDRTFNMTGGTITGNNATTEGGGISAPNDTAVLNFSGSVNVTGNTLNGTTKCNVQLSSLKKPPTALINTSGLNPDALIGIYTTGTYYDNYGVENKPFGTWTGDNCLYCFINDVNQLSGGKVSDSDHKIYWRSKPMLDVRKIVVSDWSADKTRDFSFTVALDLTGKDAKEKSELSDYGFTVDGDRGIANFMLKDGGIKTLYLPTSMNGTPYTITENLDGVTQFTTMTQKDERTREPGREIKGSLGENVNETAQSTSVTVGKFTNTRVTSSLTIAKTVDSKDSTDKTTKEYAFILTLEDHTITKDYDCVIIGKDENGNTFTVKDEFGEDITKLGFVNGVANFKLKHEQTITIQDLPKDMSFIAKEDLHQEDKKLFTSFVRRNGDEEKIPLDSETRSDPGPSWTGEVTTTDQYGHDTYSTARTFINFKLDVVCKITDRNRNLLYYKDNGELVPAVYFRLEDAFDQINNGGLRTKQDGTVSGTLRIEMLLPEYTTVRSSSLNAGKTVILATALYTDEDYPYNNGEDDGNSVAVVSRGYDGNSMIVSAGTLTVNNIILDGNKNNNYSTSNGGIIQVGENGRLTVDKVTVSDNSGNSVVISNLRNSSAGVFDGGAVWMNSNAQLTMNGKIENCTARNGGGVYASDSYRSITVGGEISGCSAVTASGVDESGYGGAIYTGTSSSTGITLNADTLLTGNYAGKDGGAIRTGATVNVKGGTVSNNTAGNNGGGVCLNGAASFTMSGGTFNSNTASNGGGIAASGATTISGGSFDGNKAIGTEGNDGRGGAIYTEESTANVIIRGNPSFTNNQARMGGVISSKGTVTMSSDNATMSGNTASVAGGAVYAEAGSFNMTAGKITGNTSDKGAVYARRYDIGQYAVLNFSGNANVSGNTSINNVLVDNNNGTPTYAKAKMNVYLEYDSNTIIKTTGLGSNASIGVYVADHEPDGENYNLLYKHGIADRNFGTYTGSNPASANLAKFSNDRDVELFGLDGELQDNAVPGVYYVMWPGKNLYIQVSKLDVEMQDGKPVMVNGKPKRDDSIYGVSGATFTLTNTTESASPVTVWSGTSNELGILTIPWSKIEATGGNSALFKENSKYTLQQETTSEECVLPSGYWKLEVREGNKVVWERVQSPGEYSESNPNPSENRTLNVVNPREGKEPVLGETFILYNDRRPKIVYDANGGTLFNGTKGGAGETVKSEEIEFKTTRDEHGNQSVDYTIEEKDPVKNSKFLNWARKQNPDELDDDRFVKGDTITFVRTSDYDDVTLYAQWIPVVCKITDRDGALLYIDGEPAIYAKLEDAFNDFNSGKRFTLASGRASTARIIKMLVDEYELLEPLTLDRGKTLILTTATTNNDNEDGYPADTNVPKIENEDIWISTIKRAFSDDASIITNNFSLTLMNITIDADNYDINGNGGIVTVTGDYASLSIGEHATLQNAAVKGYGGAVYAADNTTVNLVSGKIIGNEADADHDGVGDGAGIYLAEGSVLNISGDPSFGDGSAESPENIVKKNEYSSKENGGATVYTNDNVRQDIFVAETGETPAAVVVNGDLTGDAGSIWIWTESDKHYKQLLPFAKLAEGVEFADTPTVTQYDSAHLKVFRNARDDETTENSTGAYLYGSIEGEPEGFVFWNGDSGSRKVILRKIDTAYAPKSGKSFTIYKGTSGTAYTPKGETNQLTGLQSGVSGCFWIGTLPYGWYIVKEDDPERYYYLVVTSSGTYGTLDGGNLDIVNGCSDLVSAQTAAKEKYDALK